MNDQEIEQTTGLSYDEMSKEGLEEAESVNNEEESHHEDSAQRSRGSFFQRIRLGRLFGSFVYVYFTLFVIFHVSVVLAFLMTSMNPLVGLVLWIIIMLLGGLVIVALSLWRDHLRTFWDH